MTTINAKYANHAHYIKEGWLQEPKESFKAVKKILDKHSYQRLTTHLDVGCATGEFINFLNINYPEMKSCGCDVSDDLIRTARKLLPMTTFDLASALDLPNKYSCKFDLVTAIGVMSIFDEMQIKTFWENLLNVCAPGGLIIVFSPLNEFGVDTMVRHRKRNLNAISGWETGWNIFAKETISEILQDMDLNVSYTHFQPHLILEPKEDPVRTYTMPTPRSEWQLTNGMKLLIDHYFMVVQK